MTAPVPTRGRLRLAALLANRRLLGYLVLGVLAAAALAWILNALPERERGEAINWRTVVAACIIGGWLLVALWYGLLTLASRLRDKGKLRFLGTADSGHMARRRRTPPGGR